MKNLKKGFVALALVAVACGDNTKKWQTEIKEYRTTKVEPGIKNISDRIAKCTSSEKDFLNVKQGFKKESIEKSWVNPLKDFENQDKMTQDDYNEFQGMKQGISGYFSGFYGALDKVKC